MPRRKYTKKRATKKVSKTVKAYVKKTLANTIEDKYIDYTTVAAVPSWAYGYNYPISYPAVGTGSSNRIGDKIKPVKLEVAMRYYGTNTHSLRVVFYRWHPQTTPTGGNILDGAHASSLLAVLAPHADPYKSMYTILKDKTLTISANSTNAIIKKFKFGRKKLANIEFVNGTSTCSQQIYYLLIQDGSSSLNSVDMHCRFWYEDA